MLNASPDQLIAVTADKIGAVVVTWDQDFRHIVARISKEGAGRLRHVSRINFKCSEPQGKARLEQEIDHIEFIYERKLAARDKRMLVEIKTTNVTYS
jgi:hypothetical protein